MKFYAKLNDEYIDCFSFEGVSKATLIKLFMKIDKVLKSERDKLSEKDKWTVFTMSVDSNGAMKTFFDYNDHSEDMIAFVEVIESDYYACDEEEEGETKTLSNGVASVCMDEVWTPQDMVSKFLNKSCTEGAKDTYKFKLQNGSYATLKMVCDEGEWVLDDVTMP